MFLSRPLLSYIASSYGPINTLFEIDIPVNTSKSSPYRSTIEKSTLSYI